MSVRPTKLDATRLRSSLKTSRVSASKHLQVRHPEAVAYLRKRGIEVEKIREHAVRLVASGVLSGALALSLPLVNQAITFAPSLKYAGASTQKLQNDLISEISPLLPAKVEPLRREREEELSVLFERVWGIKVYGELEGEHLNQTYGYIGAEQHLPRYPGDTVSQHGGYYGSGITPGKGAWGYFANSKSQMTQDLVQKEKYYVAVQTLYLPDWNTRLKYLRDWYKYRKVLVVNPINGKTIVAVVADAGPAKFTGKHFGGSPEVMAYLGLNVGMQKGPVILFFVDDSDEKVPLGPLEYNLKLGQPDLTT